jgi:hypothetical protein
MKACILFSARDARKRLSGGCVPSRDARQARRRLRYCACAAIIPSCRTRREGGLSFFIRLFGAPLPTLGRTVFGRSHDLASN